MSKAPKGRLFELSTFEIIESPYYNKDPNDEESETHHLTDILFDLTKKEEYVLINALFTRIQNYVQQTVIACSIIKRLIGWGVDKSSDITKWIHAFISVAPIYSQSVIYSFVDFYLKHPRLCSLESILCTEALAKDWCKNCKLHGSAIMEILDHNLRTQRGFGKKLIYSLFIDERCMACLFWYRLLSILFYKLDFS